MNEIIGNIDDLGGIRSDINQVTEEDVQRIQENSKKAQQIAQQIKKDKAINQQLAQFLTFLMKEIEDEELIKALYRSFFRTTDPQNQITYLRKDINTYVLVGFFAPFYLEEIKEYRIQKLFEPLGATIAGENLKNYTNYLKQLSGNYHDNIPIDQKALIELIILIIKKYLSSPKSENLKEEVMLALYGGRA